jgi:dihydrofolate reductase
MRKLNLSIMTSLDGHTARPNRDLEWFLTDPEFERDMLALLRSVDGMIFGRIAYEELAQFWPSAGTEEPGHAPGGFTSDANRIEFARLMNSIPKLVVSRTLKDLSWGPGRLIRGDLAAEVAKLKAEPGRDLVLFAGAGIASSFIELDLFDEYRLYLHPLVLGRGLPLFHGVRSERPLELVQSKPYPCGVVCVEYRRRRSS